MAENVKIGVQVDDGGTTKKVVKDARELRTELEGAAKAGASIRLPQGAAPGGTAGSRRAADMSGTDYGRARGTAGTTGASARDFANQAQGLGGLVRLYATYAANVFAVSAAFTALSNAMDTTNMIKGLDQLGAASGMALGSLSKQLVDTTDGAISLRTAMEATAKATSSGMNSTQVLRMGEAAKKASMALGVDMNDAISRLSRGIVKLEPELLDELGIFVRIDDVVQKYALSVGKSASAITDFEKRQAFANAVLDQAEKKFSAIKLDANPYNKLTAALADLTQKALELVNVAIVPVVNLLSSSPTTLGIVIAGLATMLLKQAIPAFGQYRKHLEGIALESKVRATQIYLDQQEILDKGDEMAYMRGEAAFRASSAAIKQVKALETSASVFADTARTKWSELAAKNPYEMTTKEIAALEGRVQRVKKTNAEEAALMQAHVNNIKALRLEATNAGTAEQAAFEKRTSGPLSGAGQTKMIAERAMQFASAADIRNTVAQTQALYGAREAWKKLNIEIKEAKAGMRTVEVMDKLGNVVTQTVPATGALQNGWLRLSGVFGIATGAISRALAAFQPWILVITLAIEAFAILDSSLSNNKEELDAFAKAIDRANESTKTLVATLKYINEQPFGERFSTEALEARAKAITEVGVSTTRLIKNLEDVEKASNKWDKFIDNVKSLWGGDVRTKMAEALSTNIIKALDALKNSEVSAKARANIAALLQIDPTFTQKQLEEALRLPDNRERAKQITKDLEAIGMAQGVAASKSRELDEAFKTADKTLKELMQSFKASDPISKFGLEVAQTGTKLAQALTGEPQVAIKELSDIANDFNKLALFDEQDRALLSSYASELKALTVRYDEEAEGVAKVRKEIEKLEKAREDRAKSILAREGRVASQAELDRAEPETARALETARGKLADQQSKLDRTRADMVELTAKFPDTAFNQFAKGADLMSAQIVAGMAKGSFALKEAIYGALGDIPGMAQERIKIDIQKLEADKSLLMTQVALIRAVQENTTVLQLQNAEEKLQMAKNDTEGLAGLDASALDKQVKELREKLNIFRMDPSEALKGFNQLKEAVKNGNKEVAADSQAMLNYLSSIGNAAVQIAAINNQIAAKQFQSRLADIADEINIRKRANDLELQSNNTKLEAIARSERVNELLTEQEYAEEARLQRSQINIELQNKLLEIEKKRKTIAEAEKEDITPKAREALKQEKGRLDTEETGARAAAESKLANQTLASTDKIFKKEQQRRKLANELADIYKKANRTLEDTKRLIEDIALSTAEATNKYSDEFMNVLKDEQKIRKLNADAARDIEDEKTSYSRLQAEQNAEYLKALEQNASDETIARMIAKWDAERAGHLAAMQQIEERKKAEIAAIEEIAKYRKEQETRKLDLESIKTLDALWEGLGTRIAGAMKAQFDYNDIQKQNANEAIERKKLEAQLAQTEDPEAALALQDKINKSKADSAKREQTAMSGLIAANKKMFSEKTAAYKILDGLEKAHHVMVMMNNAQQLMSSLKATGELVVNAIKTMVSSGGAAVTAAGAGGDPYTVIPRMAAAAAFVASIISAFGGGSGPSVPAITAAQRQEVQGTAMGFDDGGNLVQVRRGVFGDTGAKSESIANSIEIIKNNSVDGLAYDNQVLFALQNIEKNTESAAKDLYGIKGLRSGTLTGVSEGSRTSGIRGLFGKTTTTEIIDSGIKLSGTFRDLANAAEGSVKAYEVVKTTTNRSGFLGIGGGTSTAVDTIFSDIPEEAIKSLRKTFVAGEQVLMGLADMAKIGRTEVADALNTLSVDQLVSLRGLTGEALQSELSAVMGSILDDAAYAIFESYEKFADFGEGLLETVVRVLDSNMKVEQALKNVGIASIFDTLMETGVMVTEEVAGFLGLGTGIINTISRDTAAIQLASAEITESLIDNAGGLEEFLQQAEFFRSNFFTEAEQLAATTTAVTTEMNRLGLGWVDTREEFRAVVQSLDLTTESGRLTYQALMNVADGFTEVYPEIEDLGTSIRDMLEGVFNFSQGTVSSLLKEAVKAAQASGNAVDAFNLAASKSTQLMYDSIVDMAIESISKLVFDAVVQPISDYAITAATNAATLTTTAATTSATTTVTGGITAGASVAAGGQIAATALAGIVQQATSIVETMTAVLMDPAFQTAIGNLGTVVGTFAQNIFAGIGSANLPGYTYGGSAGGTTEDKTKAIFDKLREGIASVDKEIAKMNMTAYQSALYDIRLDTQKYITELVDAGASTQVATQAATEWADAQVRLLDARNAKQATELLDGLQTEIINSASSLTPLQKELAGISTKASEYKDSLFDLGQATDENLAKVDAWATAMSDAATTASLNQARDILDDINYQIAEIGMSDTDKELYRINRQTTEYRNQLISLGMSVGEATTATNAWNAAMIASLNTAAQESPEEIANRLAALESTKTEILDSIADLGLSDLEKEFRGVARQATEYTTALIENGMAAEDAIAFVSAWSQAMTTSINERVAREMAEQTSANIASASEMLLGLSREVAGLSMTDLERELFDINIQAQDYVRQLQELGQATQSNLDQVTAWANAMRESAQQTALATSMEEYNNALEQLGADVTTSLAGKLASLRGSFDRLGLAMPTTTAGFRQLLMSINISSQAGLDLRNSLIELVPAFLELNNAVQDQLKAAYENRVSELESSIDKFKDFSQSIRDFKQSLIQGQLSPLTPEQKFLQAQQEFVRLSTLAQQGDVDAIAKLQSAAEEYLTISQTMNASSQNYIDDFNTVVAVLDSTESVAEIQMHTAIDTLAEVRNTVGELIDIGDTLDSIDTSITGLGTQLTTALSTYSLFMSGSTGASIPTGSDNLPQFAVGTAYVPQDMIAKVHQGERIIPAVQNTQLTQAMVNKNQSDKELLNQITKLNEKISQLEATVARGAVINAEATDRNTEEIARTVRETGSNTVYATKLERKVSII